METLFFLFAAGAVFLYYHLRSPRVIGAAGERSVNSILRGKLGEDEYTLLADLTLPTPQGTTQIDHVILSRYGVFVIETKNMSGWIFGGESQASWTQVMRRHKSQFQNPLRQNYHHLKVVKDLLGIRLDQMENLVAFVGSAQPRTEMPPNVFWTRRGLLEHIASRKVVRFTDDEVRSFADKLRGSALEANNDTRRAHIEHVREKATRKESGTRTCPRCGSTMIERTNRSTGKSFLGCSRYPKCRGVR